MKKNDQQKNHVQLIWAGVLISAGIAVVLEIPGKMSQLAQLWHSSATIWAFRICFYLIGILLVGGGIRKIIQYFQPNDLYRKDIRDNDESDG
jgi:predicted nucleic acid-binding Zn ribbon protein